MNLIERAKNIVFTPKTEWEKIAVEATSTGELYKRYIVPLAGIGPIASFIGLTLIGVSIPFLGHYRAPFMSGLSSALLSFAFGLIGVYILSLIINALAPAFNGEKNQAQAIKVATYAYTPAWIAGVLQIIPALSILVIIISLYCFYLLYLGLPVLMRSPKEKAVGYTAVVVLCGVVLSIAIGFTVGTVVGFGNGIEHMRAGIGANEASESSSTGNPSLDKLKQLGGKMEAANKKMEAAQQSGDTQAQMSAAAEAMGTLMGGGAKVEPVDQKLLKAMLPDSLVDLKRTRIEAEKTGMGGINVAKAEGSYGDGQGPSVDLSITDMGGAQMLGALAAWTMVEQDKETDGGYEKTAKVDGRPVHEQFTKSGQQGEYSVVVGGRFLVEARGSNVEMDTLKKAVGSLDLGKLESMKNEGLKP